MSIATPTQLATTLPFGKWKDRPLSDVPSDYFQWLLREAKLSSGLRSAVAGELTRRGIEAPPAPAPRPIRPCPDHPNAGAVCFWMEDRLGRRRIRAECGRCRKLVDHPPCLPPYTDLADAAASQAPILHALIQLEGLGVELKSDGRGVWLAGDDYRKVPPDLRAIIRQNANLLARMLGRTKT